MQSNVKLSWRLKFLIGSIMGMTRSGVMAMGHQRNATMNRGSCMRHIKVCVCDRGL